MRSASSAVSRTRFASFEPGQGISRPLPGSRVRGRSQAAERRAAYLRPVSTFRRLRESAVRYRGPMTRFSLRQVKLRPGEQYRDELEVELAPLNYGGQRYLPVPEKVPAEFEITRANTGTVFSLAFTARLFGPCYRCLDDAVLELPIR